MRIGKLFRKKSIVVSILLIFWIAYLILSIGQYLVNSYQFYDTFLAKRQDVIDYQFDLAQHFLLTGKTEALLFRLEQARKIGQFDFYALFDRDELIGYYNQGAGPESLLVKIPPNQFQRGDRLVAKAMEVGPYHLTMGIFHSPFKFLMGELKAATYAMIIDILIVTTMVFLVLYLFLKDILQLSKVLRSANREDLNQIKSLSQESEILIQATKGFEVSSQSLRKDNLLLVSSMAPAIRHELKLRKSPPYQIKCTVGRVDLNGYTQMMLKNKPRELLPVLNEYFRRSRDIIERFQGGLIYQYVGDEIVFIFKETEFAQSSSTFQKAVGAVRALFLMAEEFTSPSLSSGLTLKASLSSGELNFVKLDQGYAFSGLPLIETVRMLGQISDRNVCSLIVYEKEFLTIKDWVPDAQEKSTVFKGFMETSEIVEIKSYHSLETVAQSRAYAKFADCYRYDTDLVFWLQKMRELYLQHQEEGFLKIAGSLRLMSVECFPKQSVEEFIRLLKLMLDPATEGYTAELGFSGEASQAQSKYLSMMLSLAPSFLPADIQNIELEKALEKSSQAQDPRVQANAIMAEGYFHLNVVALSDKMSSAHNRIAADAILVAGREDFDRELFERLQQFLSSGNPRMLASGLYVISTLIQYHAERDLVYLRANRYLQQLAGEVKKFLDHQNEMVKNRARISQDTIDSIGIYAH